MNTDSGRVAASGETGSSPPGQAPSGHGASRVDPARDECVTCGKPLNEHTMNGGVGMCRLYPTFRSKADLVAGMAEDMKNGYIRGKVETACFLRDAFKRDGNDAAALACSNFAAIVQVAAGATWDEIHEQGTADLLPRFRGPARHRPKQDGTTMTDNIEDALQACRDFTAEMSEKKPYDLDLKRLLAMIDQAIETRRLEKLIVPDPPTLDDHKRALKEMSDRGKREQGW